MESHLRGTTSHAYQELLAENEQLRQQVADLQDRLHESEETIRAIRQGEVDAFVVGGDDGNLHVHALLETNRHYLHLAQEAVDVAIWDWDLEANRLSHCKRLPQVIGVENLENLTGEELLRLVHPEDRQGLRESVQQIRATRQSAYEEFRVIDSQGKQRWIVIVAQLADSPISGTEHLIGVCLDVTGKKRTEAALRESEARWQTVMENTPTIIYVVDDQMRFSYINPRWGDVFGLTIKQVLGRSLNEFFPQEIAERFAANNRQVLETGQPQEFEEVVPQADGEHTYISSKVPLCDAYGRTYAICGISIDITRRKRAEQALLESEERLRSLNESLESQIEERTGALVEQTHQLRQLASELADVEQRERDKLAQVLHDGLQQMLVGIKMQLPLCTGDRAPQQLKRIGELLDEAIDVSRSLAYELSPPILHTEGIREALEWLGSWFAEKHRFEVHLSADEEVPSLPAHARLILFHSVRELLLNAVKHAGVNEAWIAIGTKRDRIQIEVRDAGHGFDPHTLEGADQSEGMGLFSIRERLRALGGTLDVHSSPGAGARFTLVLPMIPHASVIGGSLEGAFSRNPDRRTTLRPR